MIHTSRRVVLSCVDQIHTSMKSATYPIPQSISPLNSHSRHSMISLWSWNATTFSFVSYARQGCKILQIFQVCVVRCDEYQSPRQVYGIRQKKKKKGKQICFLCNLQLKTTVTNFTASCEMSAHLAAIFIRRALSVYAHPRPFCAALHVPPDAFTCTAYKVNTQTPITMAQRNCTRLYAK